MRLKVVSINGQCLGLATHLSSEGHAVGFTSHTGSIGLGIVNSNTSTLADITIYDNMSLSEAADADRSKGLRVLGAGGWPKAVEDNPEYSESLIKVVGWPSGSSTKGINLYITCWFNGMRYISTYAGLVYRRFMAGGRGPDVNFTGVIANFWQPTQRILEEFLNPLEGVLRRANHRGCFHIHALVNEGSYIVKELSASFSNPLANLLFENSKIPVSDILLKLFNEDSTPIPTIDQWAAGILISIPPYPYTVEHAPVKIEGIVPGNLKHLWLIDAQKKPDGWWTTGSHGAVGYVTARGANVNEAVRRAYRTINNLAVRDLQYRDDVGNGVYTMLSNLRQYGWLK